MPFLHWFKKKSESTKTETSFLADELARKQVATPETVGADWRQETGPGTPPNEEPAADFQPIPQNVPQNAASTSTLTVNQTDTPSATPHISVPIGAFYAKLPAHLLASKKPDLTQSVQIAEEDVVLDQETQEATLSLSILSLSCPDLFVRGVEGSDDVPVTFSLHHPRESEPPPPADSTSLEEPESPLSPGATASDAAMELGGTAGGGANEIRLRLQPILTDFPPQLEPPAIRSLIGTQREIALPLDLIQSQLAYGRVVVPAEIFCRALPSELKPYFQGIDPAAEIPIPLQEIFSRLPPEAIERREDQEMDRLEETIPTPFSAQAEEDAERFSRIPPDAAPSANDTPDPKDEPPKAGLEGDTRRLQAIFMTDEPLDLAKTIQRVTELPGLKSCLLSTIDGLKLAGNLGDPGQEKPTAALLSELFQGTQSKLETVGAGTLETITLYCGLQQLSTFVQGKLCLTVLHDNRPFKPGVREKIQAVLSELAALSASENPL
jgi:predicted regulator of Ras-like GTPase activity (Roadblock/LC7/MglB family)